MVYAASSKNLINELKSIRCSYPWQQKATTMDKDGDGVTVMSLSKGVQQFLYCRMQGSDDPWIKSLTEMAGARF